MGLPLFLGGLLHVEVRQKTLGMIFLIPRPSGEILMEMIQGKFLLTVQFLPPIIIGAIGACVFGVLDLKSPLFWFGFAVFPIFVLYAAYGILLIGLASMRIYLIRSEILQGVAVVLSITVPVIIGMFFIIAMNEMFGLLLAWIFLGGLIFIAYITFIPAIPWLWRGILQGIRDRMADD